MFENSVLGKPSTASIIAGALTAVGLTFPAMAEHVHAESPIEESHGAQLIIPMMDPQKGMRIFVDKGCVACHAVNGVGGHDAPPMDAHRRMGLVNPFDFAAKMWNHAPGMIAAQEGAFGEQIYFTGTELAHMIAFLHDDEAQHAFSEKSLTKKVRAMMVHDHGNKPAPKAHAKEVGHAPKKVKVPHKHAEGTAKHED